MHRVIPLEVLPTVMDLTVVPTAVMELEITSDLIQELMQTEITIQVAALVLDRM